MEDLQQPQWAIDMRGSMDTLRDTVTTGFARLEAQRANDRTRIHNSRAILTPSSHWHPLVKEKSGWGPVAPPPPVVPPRGRGHGHHAASPPPAAPVTPVAAPDEIGTLPPAGMFPTSLEDAERFDENKIHALCHWYNDNLEIDPEEDPLPTQIRKLTNWATH